MICVVRFMAEDVGTGGIGRGKRVEREGKRVVVVEMPPLMASSWAHFVMGQCNFMK